MPELPEVETVRRTLRQLITGRTVRKVTVLLPRIIQRIEPQQFCDALIGETVKDVQRRGKYLRIMLNDLTLLSHLRMEGRYGLFDADDPVETHTHVIFDFEDGKQLRYKDVRQFGTMELFPRGTELISPPLNKLGVEPLDDEYTVECLRRIVQGRSTKIKPLLLDQRHIAGIGNIYVDESLYRARIAPDRPANSLSDEETAALHDAIVATLMEAVDAGGSSIKSYVNGQGEMGMFQQQLAVYGREGLPCQACGNEIIKTVIGGRGTHYCHHCQL